VEKIIYTNEEGIVLQIIPTGEVGDAIKDVPTGLDYQIVDIDYVVAEPLKAKTELKRLIDVAAGNARSRFISEGSQVVEEYRLAAAQTKEWRDAGSPSDNAPVSITSWAVAEGMSNEQSAAAIEAALYNLNGLLLTIREIRLLGKKEVNDATNDAAPAVAQGYIDQLDAITP